MDGGKPSLFQILDHLATHRRKLVLMQGRNYWTVQDLFAQAKADARSERYREAVLDRAYAWSEEDGKVVIRRGVEVIFFEPGWEPS